MHDAPPGWIAARYAVGGTLISIFLHSMLSGGTFLAVVWLYGAAMAPLTLAFAVIPSILSAPGAAIAYRMDLPWRMACAMISAAVLGLMGVLLINGSEMQVEQLAFVPVAALAAIPGCIADWMATRRERLARMARWKRSAVVACLTICVVLIAAGTVQTLRHPPALVWL